VLIVLAASLQGGFYEARDTITVPSSKAFVRCQRLRPA
jgi:hypothetical protein